ncbi:MAG: SDR family oxidoreductase [Burkholderiales bacterium]
MSRLAFITGASSGIGQALALRCYSQGYDLALSGRRVDEIERWTAAAGLAQNRFAIYQADVAQIDQIVEAGTRCIAAQGLPDVVVANAGISVAVDTGRRSDLDAVARTLATNVTGLAATFQPFVALMRARGSGRLVGIASVAGIRGLPGHAAYCASKAAVIAYCESLRGELSSVGVRVVTIVPGYIDTPLTRKNRYPMPFLMPPDAFAAKALATIEAGRSYRVLPWQMAAVSKLLRLLPDPLLDRVLRGQPRKQRDDVP